MKVAKALVTILIVYLHIYILTCTKCSTIFVWWKHFFGPEINIEFVPVVFSVLISFELFFDLIIGKRYKWLVVCISVFCITCSASWVFTIAVTGVSVWKYVLFVLFHFAWIVLSTRSTQMLPNT